MLLQQILRFGHLLLLMRGGRAVGGALVRHAVVDPWGERIVGNLCGRVVGEPLEYEPGRMVWGRGPLDGMGKTDHARTRA